MPHNSASCDVSNGYGASASIVKVPPPRGHVFVQGSFPPSNDQMKHLELRLQGQAKEIEVLTEGLRTKDDAVAQLKAQLRDMRDEVVYERQSRAEEGMRKELSSLHSELEEKRKAVESLELATDASRAIADLGGERNRLQHDLTVALQGKHSYEQKARYWEHEARTAQQSHDVIAKEAATLKNHNITMASGLQQQISSKAREVEMTCKAEEHSRVSALEQRMYQLQRALDDKDLELKARIAGEASALKEAEGHAGRCRDLERHNDELRRLLEAAGHDVESTKHAVHNMNHKLEVSVAKEADMHKELDTYRVDVTMKMRDDIDRIVKAAEKEHAALRAKLKRADEKITRLRRALADSEEREELGRELLEKQQKDAKTREHDLLNATTETREDLAMKLAATENELYTLKAAYAEAKTTALMQYFNERGEMEKEMTGRMGIMAEEVRSCTRLVRKMLERFTGHVEPPPGEADEKLITLKQLLLLLRSHSSTILEDPPQAAPCIAAWQQRGNEILKEKGKLDVTQPPPTQPFLSSITSHTVSTTTTD